MPSVQFFIALGALTVMLLAVLGILIPRLPGLYLFWIAVLFHALWGRFTVVPMSFVFTTGVLIGVLYLLEMRISQYSFRTFRLTLWGVLGAVVGSFVSLAFGWWPAVTVGPVMGAILFEQIVGHDTPYTYEREGIALVRYWGLTVVKLCVAAGILAFWVPMAF